MTDPRFCDTTGTWLADCDDCVCAARDRAEDRDEHIRRDEGEL